MTQHQPSDSAEADRTESDRQLGIDLRARAERMLDAAEIFAEAARENAETDRIRADDSRKQRRILAFAVAVFVCIAAGIFIAVLVGQSTRSTIADCVKPTGQCYQDGQKRTADVVGQLNKVSALAAACAPDYVADPLPQRVVEIQACIRRNLKGPTP